MAPCSRRPGPAQPAEGASPEQAEAWRAGGQQAPLLASPASQGLCQWLSGLVSVLRPYLCGAERATLTCEVYFFSL